MSGNKPAKLGKYEVISEIARGSMGVVYLGYDPFIDREVALKVALSDFLKDGEAGKRYRQMFFNEAHTAGMLRHPNILDMFDAGIDDDECYLVMEYVKGGKTLKPYTRTENLLPVKEAVEIIFKCAKALDYAHRQGVIHRDIKPSNILLTEDMDVKLADFSIAHINRQDSSQTMPMGFVGSPRYMSPEQVQEESITHQTDLFSLGVLLYEMLTGKHPFGGESFSSLIHKVVNEDPVPMQQYNVSIPSGLEDVVLKALQKDCELRYRSGLEMATDLSMAFGHLEKPQEDITAKRKFDEVKDLSFFRGFPDSEIWEIIRASVWEEYDPAQDIIVEGDMEDSFYIITSGDVAVIKNEMVIDTLAPGDCFGEMGYVSKTQRSASIKASGYVTLMKVNSTLIEQVSKDCQLRFCKSFMRTLIQRLADATDQMARV